MEDIPPNNETRVPELAKATTTEVMLLSVAFIKNDSDWTTKYWKNINNEIEVTSINISNSHWTIHP